MLAMELQKAVEGNQNKNINNSPGFIVSQTQLPSFVALQLNKSFLILDKEKSFCYKIYLLLTKLVWSWLLNINLILFCVFLRTSTLPQSIKSHKKELSKYPAILTSPLVNNAYLPWPINIINYDNKPNYFYLFIYLFCIFHRLMQKQMVCYLSVGGSLSTRKSSWKSATTVSLIQACNEKTTLLNNLTKVEFQKP